MHRFSQQSQWICISGSSDCNWSGFRRCGTIVRWCPCPSTEYNNDSFHGSMDGTYPETEDQIQVCFRWWHHALMSSTVLFTKVMTGFYRMGRPCSQIFKVHTTKVQYRDFNSNPGLVRLFPCFHFICQYTDCLVYSESIQYPLGQSSKSNSLL